MIWGSEEVDILKIGLKSAFLSSDRMADIDNVTIGKKKRNGNKMENRWESEI